MCFYVHQAKCTAHKPLDRPYGLPAALVWVQNGLFYLWFAIIQIIIIILALVLMYYKSEYTGKND